MALRAVARMAIVLPWSSDRSASGRSRFGVIEGWGLGTGDWNDGTHRVPYFARAACGGLGVDRLDRLGNLRSVRRCVRGPSRSGRYGPAR